MINLVQFIVRNISRTVPGIFQHGPQALYSFLFVIGIFFRLEFIQIKPVDFILGGPWNRSFDPILVPIFLRRSFPNE